MVTENTLLSKSASEVGVGVTISNGVVSVVQHQNHSGSFQGVTPNSFSLLMKKDINKKLI